MKLFLKHFILFTFFSVGIFLILLISQNFILNRKADFKLSSDTETIILGHSHPERAYNDTLIPFTKNLAGAAEPYLYTLAKTRKIIEQNPQIKTVLIECSNNQFSKEMNNWTWGNKMASKLHIYGPFLNFNEYKILVSKSPKLFLESISVLFRENLAKILLSDYNYINKIGGYSWNDLKLKKAPKTNNTEQFKFEISKANISFLKQLISYLEAKSIKVILIRTPTLSSYYNLYSEIQYQAIMNSQFRKTEFLDFSNYTMEYSNYVDRQHMNAKGAKEFSKWFSKLLKNGLLQSENKQSFINNELRARTNKNDFK